MDWLRAEDLKGEKVLTTPQHYSSKEAACLIHIGCGWNTPVCGGPLHITPTA